MEAQSIARPLKKLIPLIQRDLDAAEKAGMEYFRAAGEKLLEAKSQIPHGQFQDWVKRNLKVSARQARKYMALAEATAGQNGTAIPFFSLRDFHDSIRRIDGEHSRRMAEKPTTFAGRDYGAERRNHKAADEQRRRDREARRAMWNRLIEAGFKALALELHPDRGGSADSMALLVAVRDEMKRN